LNISVLVLFQRDRFAENAELIIVTTSELARCTLLLSRDDFDDAVN
jgi:hypothetical protein